MFSSRVLQPQTFGDLFTYGVVQRSPFWFSYSDWDIWFIPWHASKDSKDRAFVIFAISSWVLWRFRNSVTFCSQSMRKCDIFDNIRLFSFSWLNSRRKNVLIGTIG